MQPRLKHQALPTIADLKTHTGSLAASLSAFRLAAATSRINRQRLENLKSFILPSQRNQENPIR
jgi:hypothetical protein